MEAVIGIAVTASIATSGLGCAACLRRMLMFTDTDSTVPLTLNGKIPVKMRDTKVQTGERVNSLPDFRINLDSDFTTDADYTTDETGGSMSPSPSSPMSRSPRNSRTMLHTPFGETIIENQPLTIGADINRLGSDQSLFTKPPMRKKGVLRKFPSTPDLTHAVKPKLEALISYNIKERALTLTNCKVTEFISQSAKEQIFLKVHLLPTGMLCRTVVKDTAINCCFEGVLKFGDVNQDDVRKCTLFVSVMTSYGGYKKAGHVAEVLLPLEQLGIGQVDHPLLVSKSLNMGKRIKRKSTSELCLYSDLGDLLVDVHIQPRSSRLKVMVRKASGLPKADNLPGKPDYFIEIILVQNNVIVERKTTRPQRGYSPVWNEPFLFEVPASELATCILDLTVFRGRIYTKDAVVGHVTIGSDASKTGNEHWHDAMRLQPADVAKWHSIFPKLKY